MGIGHGLVQRCCSDATGQKILGEKLPLHGVLRLINLWSWTESKGGTDADPQPKAEAVYWRLICCLFAIFLVAACTRIYWAIALNDPEKS